MADREVFNTIVLPGGAVPSDVLVTVELVGESSRRIAGAVGVNDEYIEGLHKPVVDENGRWEVDLTPNSLITDPVGTVWKISERVHGHTTVTLVAVPDTAGPHWIGDIGTDEPGALPSGPLAALQAEFDAHLADTVDADDASAVSYAGSTNLAATTVEAALDELDTETVHLAGTETISGVKIFTASPNLVFDGDSQTVTGVEGQTLSTTTAGTGYPAQTVAGIDPRATMRNIAVSGQTVTTVTAAAAANVDAHLAAGKNNVVLMWGGTNDLVNAPDLVAPFPDAATVYARIVAYHQARRAAGWKTVVFTILPRTQVVNANYETDRLAVNALIRANWATFADAIADVGGDSIIGAEANLGNFAYFSDGVHVHIAGGRIVARYVKAALATLGIQTANRPATDNLYSSFVGPQCLGLGVYALAANTTGGTNVAVGYSAVKSNTTGSLNSAFGGYALQANTTGGNNTAVGMQALFSNTTGGSNTAVGLNAMYASTTGATNAALGVNAMLANTTGSDNAAFGYASLSGNTTGARNSAAGRSAVGGNTTGTDNTAAGYQALLSNTTGINNTAVGSAALRTNSSGASNSAVGVDALRANTTGINNSAVGYQALLSNTTTSNNTAVGLSALQLTTTGANNTAVGVQALLSNTTGASNTAVGRDALLSNTTGANNTAVGLTNALYSNTTGATNAAVGLNALYGNTTGTNNTAVGYNALLGSFATTTGLRQTALGALAAQASGTQRNDIVCVGYNALVDANDTVAIGSGARAMFANSVAIGKGIITTAADQVMVGPVDIEITATAKGVVIKSPDGTRYRIQVANGGALSTVAAWMTLETLLLLQHLLENQQLNVGADDFDETVIAVLAAKAELRQAIETAAGNATPTDGLAAGESDQRPADRSQRRLSESFQSLGRCRGRPGPRLTGV